MHCQKVSTLNLTSGVRGGNHKEHDLLCGPPDLVTEVELSHSLAVETSVLRLRALVFGDSWKCPMEYCWYLLTRTS